VSAQGSGEGVAESNKNPVTPKSGGGPLYLTVTLMVLAYALPYEL
jgi:hypothetical protein